jgi:hypothetical protein
MNDPAARLKEVTFTMALAIHHIPEHPDMCVGHDDPRTVDVVLLLYHRLWAQAVGRIAEFNRVYEGVKVEERCQIVGFSQGWRMRHPDTTKQDTTAFVFACWKKVTERLGIERPPFP